MGAGVEVTGAGISACNGWYRAGRIVKDRPGGGVHLFMNGKPLGSGKWIRGEASGTRRMTASPSTPDRIVPYWSYWVLTDAYGNDCYYVMEDRNWRTANAQEAYTEWPPLLPAGFWRFWTKSFRPTPPIVRAVEWK